jgi:hypothetical protein
MASQDNADWSGYCPSPNSKKHFPLPPSKIVSSVGVETTGWKPSRRVTETNANGVSSSILGGVSSMNASVGEAACAWQTEARSASAQTKTTRDQLTESGRSMFIRGKACTKPAYELSRPYDGSVAEILRDDIPYSINDKANGIVRGGQVKNPDDGKQKLAEKDGNESLVGYRSGVDAKSFLSGLGAEIAASLSSSSQGDDDEEEEESCKSL